MLAVPRGGGAAGGGAGGGAQPRVDQRPTLTPDVSRPTGDPRSGRGVDVETRPLAVAVVIPALNEELGLRLVLPDLPRGAPALGWQVRDVLVVDNGSTDRTAAVARELGAIVVSEPRRGYGAACRTGLARLAADPPDAVVFLDADHSDDPRELPAVLAPILAGRADLVIGSRVLGDREPGALTPVQHFGNRLATALLAVLYGGRFTDLGPFRAIRWSALARLALRDRAYGWTVEMQARALHVGLSWAEVPVRYRRRAAGKSKVSGTVRGVLGAGTQILGTIARVRVGM